MFCKYRYLKLIPVSGCWAQSWELTHVCLLSSRSLSAPTSGFKAPMKSNVVLFSSAFTQIYPAKVEGGRIPGRESFWFSTSMNETERLYLFHGRQGKQLLLSQTDLSELRRQSIANSVKMVSVTWIKLIIYSGRPKLSAKSFYISSQQEHTTSKPFLFQTKWNRNQRISAILYSDSENYITLTLPLNL